MAISHKRRAVLATAVAAVGSALVGTVRPAGAQNPAPVTLVVANSQWLDALRGKNLWVALLKYQRVAPHVTLKQEAIPSAAFDNKITTEFGGNQAPDIAIMQEGLFYAIASAGMLADLSDVAQGVKLNETNASGVVKGKRYGLGWQRAVYALIYNEQLVTAAKTTVPATVSGLIASSRAVMSATPGSIGFTARHQMSDFSGWFMDFQNWAYGNGASWVDSKGKLTIVTPQAVAAATQFQQMYNAKILPFGDDMPTQRQRFREAHVGFSIDNSGGALNIASGGALQAKDFGASALPFPHPGAHQQLFVTVNARSAQKQAALDFVKWLMGPSGQQALREASGPDTLATDVPMSAEYLAANPWTAVFPTLAKTSRSTLIPGHETDTPQIMRSVMKAVEQCIVAQADPKTALEAAQREVDDAFS